MITLNRYEVDALVSNLAGLTDDANFTTQSVELSRQDSLGRESDDGFLVLTYRYTDGPPHADAISEVGATSSWRI